MTEGLEGIYKMLEISNIKNETMNLILYEYLILYESERILKLGASEYNVPSNGLPTSSFSSV